MSDEQKKNNEIEEQKLDDEQLEDVSGGLFNRASSSRQRTYSRGSRPVTDVSPGASGPSWFSADAPAEPAADPTLGKISNANVSGPAAPVPGLGGASGRRTRRS